MPVVLDRQPLEVRRPVEGLVTAAVDLHCSVVVEGGERLAVAVAVLQLPVLGVVVAALLRRAEFFLVLEELGCLVEAVGDPLGGGSGQQ